MLSDIASSILGTIIMLALAYMYAKQKSSNWYRGASWGGRQLPEVVPVSAPRTLDEALDYNLRAGRLVWGWR